MATSSNESKAIQRLGGGFLAILASFCRTPCMPLDAKLKLQVATCQKASNQISVKLRHDRSESLR